MAKCLYEDRVKPKLNLIQGWARDGYTDKNIYERLGIGKNTFYQYLKQFTDFADAIKKGKDDYDNEVVNSLYNNTIGQIVTLKRPFKVRRREYNGQGRLISEYEEVVYADYEEYVKPDTTAQIYWLNNRRPNDWRNKQSVDLNGDIQFNSGGLQETLEELRRE